MTFDDDLAHTPASGPGWLDMDAYPEVDPDSVAPADDLAALGAELRAVPTEDLATLTDDAVWGQLLDGAVAVEDIADVTATAFDDVAYDEPGAQDHDRDRDDAAGGDDGSWPDDDWAGDTGAFDAQGDDADPDDPHPAADADPDQP